MRPPTSDRPTSFFFTPTKTDLFNASHIGFNLGRIIRNTSLQYYVSGCIILYASSLIITNLLFVDLTGNCKCMDERLLLMVLSKHSPNCQVLLTTVVDRTRSACAADQELHFPCMPCIYQRGPCKGDTCGAVPCPLHTVYNHESCLWPHGRRG